MQLPLTGVFNRLALSVCRATVDTQVIFMLPIYSSCTLSTTFELFSPFESV
jgi:hypothetical protein